jgi:hypothetical protein
MRRFKSKAFPWGPERSGSLSLRLQLEFEFRRQIQNPVLELEGLITGGRHVETQISDLVPRNG